MPCSAVTLSLATIAAIVSVALLSIAFSTDNWLTYEVKRNNIQVCVNVFVCRLLCRLLDHHLSFGKGSSTLAVRSSLKLTHSPYYNRTCFFLSSVSCYIRNFHASITVQINVVSFSPHINHL